ncbi:MAG: elongation factor Ts [Spirochaetes bacterium]|nr:elongation factor Ts [Spirochaetota bacterium]
MGITTQDIKKLRDLTNAGMLDCKNALEKSNGNIDEALKYLKEKGLADAKKRSERETKEGGIFIKTKDNKIAVIQLGCETDFVSKNEIFIKTKEDILDKILNSGNDKIESYKEDIQMIIAQTKENVEFKNAKYIELKNNQYASTYIHGNNKIGVVCVLDNISESLKNNDKLKEASNNICLHIAANSPFYLTEKDVPANEIQEQKDIMIKQMADTKKPPEVLSKIVDGKIQKYFSEICLLNQKYVKDDKITVSKYLENVSKELQTEIKISNFIRYMIGK